MRTARRRVFMMKSSSHSHQLKIETKNGTLFFNPGSAGPRRFRLPITVGRCPCERSGLGDSSVRAAVNPAPVHRRVLYTLADVPRNAGRLVALQVCTALHEHQRRSQQRGFDDIEHGRPLPVWWLSAGTRAEEGIPHAHRRCDHDPQKAGENVAQ
jgi:Calcineurin-like phosphoesterase superfamily domain